MERSPADSSGRVCTQVSVCVCVLLEVWVCVFSLSAELSAVSVATGVCLWACVCVCAVICRLMACRAVCLSHTLKELSRLPSLTHKHTHTSVFSASRACMRLLECATVLSRNFGVHEKSLYSVPRQQGEGGNTHTHTHTPAPGPRSPDLFLPDVCVCVCVCVSPPSPCCLATVYSVFSCTPKLRERTVAHF